MMTKDEIILAQQARIEQLKESALRLLRNKRGDDDWLILTIDCVGLEETLSIPDDLSALRVHDAELIGSHSVHETLVRQTQIDAARIEELERERDEWKARAEFSYKQRDELEREIERKMSAGAFVLKERDALQADNAQLREALDVALWFVPDHPIQPENKRRLETVKKALANTPEQSLAEYRNKLIEQMIACYSPDDSAHDYFDKLNALKDQK